MTRAPGLSARLKLTLSYVGFLMVSGVLLLAVVWAFLLRYVPQEAAWIPDGFMPGRDDLVRAFLPAAAWALGFLLLLAVVGGWLLAGRMLAPLDRITAVARAAGAGDLDVRVALPGPGDEFRELADSFDAMLAQLQEHLAEQQRFAANASHELRTPLAITRTTLEVARRDPDLDADALVERLSAVNDRAIELTEALLLLSRSGHRSVTPEPVDLSLVAEEAGETLLGLAEGHGVAVRIDGPVVHASGSPALLGQLVTNLVHNAIVHNLPSGGEVRVETAAGAAGARPRARWRSGSRTRGRCSTPSSCARSRSRSSAGRRAPAAARPAPRTAWASASPSPRASCGRTAARSSSLRAPAAVSASWCASRPPSG